MPVDSGSIAGQIGAAGGLWTHTPVDWRGNETGQAPPGPAGWPTSPYVAVPPGGNSASVGSAPPPTITAISITGIGATGATANWTVQPSSSSIVEWGTTTAYGSASPPSVGAGARTYAIGSLTTLTLYHYRIGSTANGFTTYTSDRTFTTT